jgi:hypothetical protein
LISVAEIKTYCGLMANWNSNGFLGVYADLLEKTEPPKEDKLETLKQLRIQQHEKRQAKCQSKGSPGKTPEIVS